MKKNLFFAAILCIGLLAIINSCVKDTFTEQDAYDEQRKSALQQDSIAKSNMELEASLAQEQALLLDSLKKVGGVINYSVAAVVASESSWWTDYVAIYDKGEKSEKGLTGAVVTLAQHGRLFTVTTDASGIASFKDLRIGTANVNIKLAGYTEVDFVVEFAPLTEGTHTEGYEDYSGDSWSSDTTTNNIVDIVRHVATMVPVFSLTDNLTTISGKATVELDLTNNAPEAAAGVKIIGIIEVEDYDFWNTYIYVPGLLEYWDNYLLPHEGFKTYYGNIKQIAFHNTVSTATTDANGMFSLQVPSTPQGLPIRITFDEFAADQTLLLPTLGGLPVWGPQTVRTLFGWNVGSTSSIPALGITTAAQVQSAYVTFSDPTGSPAAQPTEKALATAVLTSSGIISVNITDQGEGYTQAPWVKISKGTAYNSIQAEGTAVISGGKVTDVTITSAGSGYKPDDTPTINFVEGLSEVASAQPKMGYSLGEVPVLTPGSGYTAAPTVTITSSTGTGATATAVTTGYVSALTVTNAGAGYTATPNVTIAPSTGVTAVAGTVTMTTNNPVHSITVPSTNTYWARRRVGTRINGVGSGAVTDSTILSSAGRVMTAVTMTNPGAGYLTLSPPTVTISGGGGTGAIAHATVAGGQVTVVIDAQGQGYTTIPTVTIGPPPAGGTNATATVLLEYHLTGVSVTASGNGYVAASTTLQFESAPGLADWANNTAGATVNLSMGVVSIAMSATTGTEYTTAPAVTITPSNGVVGTAATATSAIAYGVKNILVTAQGSGYEYGDITVSLTPPPAGGTAATLNGPVMINGVLKRVVMGLPGVGYTAAPHVYLAVAAGGAIPIKQAELSATVSGGQITGITIVDPGLGYEYASEAPTNKYSIVITTFNSGAAASANPNPESGKIAFIQVDDPGAGYSIVPTVEFTNVTTGLNNNYQGNANGFGSGATATAVVVDGRVTAINVTNAGAGYYFVPTVNVNVTSAVMKAMGLCDVTADGRITDVVFPSLSNITKGYGYDSAPTLTFTPAVPGKGTGAVGVAVIKDGMVDDVIMTNQGSGYVGKNRATGLEAWLTGDNRIKATAGRSVVKDLYFGTGRRTVD